MIDIPLRPKRAFSYARLLSKLAPYQPENVVEDAPNVFTITTVLPVPDDVRDWVSANKPGEMMILFEAKPPN